MAHSERFALLYFTGSLRFFCSLGSLLAVGIQIVFVVIKNR